MNWKLVDAHRLIGRSVDEDAVGGVGVGGVGFRRFLILDDRRVARLHDLHEHGLLFHRRCLVEPRQRRRRRPRAGRRRRRRRRRRRGRRRGRRRRRRRPARWRKRRVSPNQFGAYRLLFNNPRIVLRKWCDSRELIKFFFAIELLVSRNTHHSSMDGVSNVRTFDLSRGNKLMCETNDQSQYLKCLNWLSSNFKDLIDLNRVYSVLPFWLSIKSVAISMAFPAWTYFLGLGL